MMQEERFQVAGIGEIRLRLVPTLAEVAEAEREKRARGFFLHLVRALLLEPAFSHHAWASLPEDALRPVAVRLAEANDLAALFRPKREKPFYNAFRNAWRMSRATHNEAAFQRAIAVWKAHLAASLARAKAAYDRAAGTDRTAATRLAKAGFIVSPQVLARPDVQEAGRADGPIGPALCALFSNEALRDPRSARGNPSSVMHSALSYAARTRSPSTGSCPSPRGCSGMCSSGGTPPKRPSRSSSARRTGPSSRSRR